MKSSKHLACVRQLPCCVCKRKGPSDPHHLRALEYGRGMGKKSGDQWTVPLCRACHNDVHLVGTKEEVQWFNEKGLDSKQLAQSLHEASPDVRKMKSALLRLLW